MPSVGRSVQFRGIDNVVTAYENMQIPRWGMFQGSQFLAKYDGNNLGEGAELLEQILKGFDLRGADNSTYTLCVYDGLADGEKIKSNTKYDGSFNFRLVDNYDQYAGNKAVGRVNDDRINALEQKIDLLLSTPEVEDEAEPVSPLMAMIGKILEHPEVQQRIAGIAGNLMDKLTSGIGNVLPMENKPVAKVAGLSSIADNPETENDKFTLAVNILAPIDPELGTHLLKLANVAKNDPSKYQQLISMLNLL